MSRPGGTPIQSVYDLAYGLIGVVPYALVVFALAASGLDLSEGLPLIAALAFFSQLAGVRSLRRSAEQLRALCEQMDEVRASVPVTTAGPIRVPGRAARELERISDAFNGMARDYGELDQRYRDTTIKLIVYARDVERYQQRLAREALIRARLSRYVGEDVVAQIQRSDGEFPLQNTSREITVLFADIRSFTTLCERLTPEEVLGLLNEYFDHMVEIIFEHHGVLDKFVGDELMALFGVLRDPALAPEDAIHAGLAMQRCAAELMIERRRAGKPEFSVGIGINTGTVVIGNVGSRNRMDYTAIGDAVNVAARLEKMAPGGAVLIGEATRERAPATLEYVEMGALKVRNRSEPVHCYEVREPSG